MSSTAPLNLPLLLEPAELEPLLGHPQLILADLCRPDNYQVAHLPGAIHLSPAETQEGLAPAPGFLPDRARLQQLADKLGLAEDKWLVVYDDEGGGWAGRLIWLLDSIGFQRYSYLNGGLIAWHQEGRPLTDQMPASAQSSSFPIQIRLQRMENVPDRVMDAAGALAYNSLVSVFLGIRGEVPPLSWLYVPELSFGEFNRISFPSNYTREGAPPGHASILAEITFRPGDPVGSWSDAETIRHVSDGLSRMGLLKPEDVVYTAISRQDYAYVIYDLDYQEHVGIVRTFCREQGIDLVGRFAEFEYLNMDACIRHAWDYAERSG